MKISETGLNLIKQFEGCRLTAYKCSAGVWTIGWGHTGDVYQGQTITQEKADALLVSDMATYEAKVNKYSSYDWNQNEFDALVSFAYNVGSIYQLTANGTRSKNVIAEKMLLYNKAAGTALAGLTRRRKAERELFLTPVEETVTTKYGWVSEADGWRYYLGDGTPITNDWYQDTDGSWYWFRGDGFMVTDTWYQYNNKWYYLGDDGRMMTGQVTVDGKWYVMGEDGAMITDPVVLTPNKDGALVYPGLAK